MFTSRFEQCEIRLQTDLIMPTVVITLDAFDLDVVLRILIGYLHDHNMQEMIQGIFVSDYIAGKSFVDGALQRCEDEKIELDLVNLPYREKGHQSSCGFILLSSLMLIQFNVQEPYKSQILSGQKTVEGRLNKGKF